MQIETEQTTGDTQAELNARRFSGIARLYGELGLAQLNAAHVCVIGLGGVGSWACESFARSGVGELSLIDMDVVSESNINRQLLATDVNVGRDKSLVMRDRIATINPAAKVNVIDDFISESNLAQYILSEMHFVVDCIDDFRTKAALIHYCRKEKIKIITIGGAGGQVDPSKIRQCDLSGTQHDVLLAKTRKLLRQDYRFARNPKRSFGVPCIYSDEQLIYPDGVGGLSAQKPPVDSELGDTISALNCAGGIGSVTHVTGAFAFHAAAFVLNQLVNNNE
jgi:tRNA A37 threonylcarbamoyladenosine dehydratase